MCAGIASATVWQVGGDVGEFERLATRNTTPYTYLIHVHVSIAGLVVCFVTGLSLSLSPQSVSSAYFVAISLSAIVFVVGGQEIAWMGSVAASIMLTVGGAESWTVWGAQEASMVAQVTAIAAIVGILVPSLVMVIPNGVVAVIRGLQKRENLYE